MKKVFKTQERRNQTKNINDESLIPNNYLKKEIQKTLIEYNFKINKKNEKSFPSLPTNCILNICSWNVNGLRAILQKNALNELIQKENPDILCIIETKIEERKIRELRLNSLYEQYTTFWNSSVDKYEYTGVGILTKYQPDNISYGMYNNKDGRIISLEFPKLYIIAVNSPYSGNKGEKLEERLDWEKEFNKYLLTLRASKKVILCGTLNVAHQDIDVHDAKNYLNTGGFFYDEKKSFEKLLDTFEDSFRLKNQYEIKYTYFPANDAYSKIKHRGMRLDYLLVDKESQNEIESSEILNQYNGSDHAPIKLNIKIK